MTEHASTRSSRNRRVVALMGWGCLLFTAFVLWNARQSGSIRAVTDEPVAFILAAFAAFVSVFAWMLYNPDRRSVAESPSLFLASTATLFPPSIIGFCLMPIDSPLRWWLALGLFLLCVIAVLSHVPDEFFGVPRGRHTYLTPIPAFDRVEGTVLDPNASWFKLEDLSRVVLDTERPSLVPRSYLQRGEPTGRTPTATRAEVRPLSEVDDILGTDFDLGLLDDELTFDDRPSSQTSQRQSPVARSTQRNEETASKTRQPVPLRERFRRGSSTKGAQSYATLNPESGRLRTSQRVRREVARQSSTGQTRDRKLRHASSLHIEGLKGRTTGGDYSTRTSASGTASGLSRSPLPAGNGKPQSYAQNESTDSSAGHKSVEGSSDGDTAYSSNRESVRESRQQRKRQQKQRREEAAERAQEAERQRTRESHQSRDKNRQQTRSPEHRQTARKESSSSVLSAVPMPLDPVAPPQGFLEEPPATPNQLMGQTIQRETGRDTPEPSQPVERTGRRSRYERNEDRETESGSSRKRSRAVLDSTAAPPTQRVQPSRSSTSQQQQQEFDRTSETDGSELVEGVMPIHFGKGQKRANVHIPFSPPLRGMPEVECECVGGEDVRLKVPVRQSYGIRIEARRTNADQPLDAEIGFSAVYTND